MERVLQINKTRFFALLKEDRRDPEAFSIRYERETGARIYSEVEVVMAEELWQEKKPAEDSRLPIVAQ